MRRAEGGPDPAAARAGSARMLGALRHRNYRLFLTGQIISKISHRDKGPNNALVAKAVEICAREGVPYLVYMNWGSGSLSEFKRRNGFQKVTLPRYYVPLTSRGRMALHLGLHKGFRRVIPEPLQSSLKRLRTKWYSSVYSLMDRTAPAGAHGDAEF